MSPIGIPKAGYRRTKHLKARSIKTALEHLEGDIPGIIEELKKLAYGKPVICPECGHEVGLKQIDREAAIYLIDRVLGKPTQRTEVDITERIVLTSVQIEKIIQRYQLAQRLMLPAGSTSTLTQGSTDDIIKSGGKDAIQR